MDVSYLVDGVMDGLTGRALRWPDVLVSPLAFNVVATSLDTLTPVILHSPFQNVRDLKTALKASAAVPLFAGPKPVRHRGQRLVDAAVMEPVPVHAAAADGCTHVLVLLTRVLDRDDAALRDDKDETKEKRLQKKRRNPSRPARSDRWCTKRCAARCSVRGTCATRGARTTR
jgi:predicted acylesterase/phospholipase RssA